MGNSDSTAAIRGVVTELCHSPVDESTAWERLLVASTPEAVFSAIQLEDVREMRQKQPRNLVLLLRKLIEVMQAIGHSPSSEHYPTLLTCIRIMTRVVPAIMEESETDFLHKVMWENRVPPPSAPSDAGVPPPPPPPAAAETAPGDAAATGAVGVAPAADGDAKAEEGGADAGAAAGAGADADAGASGAEERIVVDTPLGRLLVHTVFSLAFLPNFTVPKDQYDLWAQARAESEAHLAAATGEGAASADGAAAAATAGEDAAGAATGAGAGAGGEGAATEAAAGTEEAAAPPAPAAEDWNSPALPTTAVVETLLLWAPGVGFPDHPSTSTATIDRNRVEVLRLMLTLMSGPLYHVPNAASPVVDQFCSEMVSPHVPLLPTLFYSLVNTVLEYDPVGWGVPYGSSLVTDTKEPLMNMALHLLLVVLDYAPYREVHPSAGNETYGHHAAGPEAAAAEGEGAAPGDAAAATPDGEAAASAAAADTDGDGGAAAAAAASDAEPALLAPPPPPALVQVPNLFRGLLAGLHSPQDFATLYKGLSRLLNQVHRADNTYLPYSMKQLDNHQEVLVLLWKAMDTNPGFLSYILYHETALTDLVVPVLYCMYQARNKAARVGLVHICTFTLLLLSGSRNFGVALNEPFDQKLPADLPLFRGNHADLLFIVLHKLIVAGNEGLRPLYNCFMTVMANVSPYVKKLSMVASVKLVNLYELFSSRKFLFRRRANHQFVGQLLNVFTNVIQYQYEGNTHLVYAILRRKVAFYQLASLTLPAAARAAAGRAGSVSSPSPAAIASAAAASAAAAGTDGAGADAGGDAAGDAAGAGAATSSEAPAASPAPAPAPAPAATAAAGGAGTGVGAGAGAGAGPGSDAAAPPPPPPPPAVAAPWRPTAEWLASWHGTLMLEPVLRLVNYLAPRMEAFCAAQGSGLDDAAVVAFLEKTTVVGVLPVPHRIMMRRFQANEYTHLWFTTFTWGTIFLKNQDLALMDARSIKLFSIAYIEKEKH